MKDFGVIWPGGHLGVVRKAISFRIRTLRRLSPASEFATKWDTCSGQKARAELGAHLLFDRKRFVITRFEMSKKRL